MPAQADRLDIARTVYTAFAGGEREVIEKILAPDFRFYSPPDPGLDREGYFRRCWPHSGDRSTFDFVRLVESGDEVIVTYEVTRVDGGRARNTEVLTFDAEKVVKAEVYFGWNL